LDRAHAERADADIASRFADRAGTRVDGDGETTARGVCVMF
jgi:hypothetical protein